MATGYEIVQTLNKKRLPNKFENLGYNRTFLNGKYTLSLHLFSLWLRSYGLVGDENIAFIFNIFIHLTTLDGKNESLRVLSAFNNGRKQCFRSVLTEY